MLKNATFLPFYFADNQLFSNSETLVVLYDVSSILRMSHWETSLLRNEGLTICPKIAFEIIREK
jgi:hypothetical protein